MFERILIANRGEIACRVIRAARHLGIATVAVYSDADSNALHVRQADSAYRLGPPPARDSYLDITKLIEAAQASGADAVHPGYGFLSESAEFAEACRDAGLVFIGPSPEAMRAMGLKDEAKRIMEKAGVPLLPGYHGGDQGGDDSDKALAAAAKKIGFPVMVKAAAGGGGRGMRIVTDEKDLAEALAGARREAEAGFGNGSLLIERYLGDARHIEMQVFGDSHGNAVHLFERDCSIQRRHQKIIEEAPAPGMTEAMRAAMAEAAIQAAQAIDYVGAGTVEFLVDAASMGEVDCFYFMEMNTRLQVEHPVTEMIVGQDLVEWQIRVAAGETLPLAQEQISLMGHAIEARLYAEDPKRGFMPSPGSLRRFATPYDKPYLRLETGVVEGDEITPFYDPMIAKLIAWGPTREAATSRLAQALGETHLVGPETNLDFLAQTLTHPSFAAGAVDTRFVDTHSDALFAGSDEGIIEDALACAALAEILWRAEDATRTAASSQDPHSPWRLGDGWRLGGTAAFTELNYIRSEGGEGGEGGFSVRARQESGATADSRDAIWHLEIGERAFATHGHLQPDGRLGVILDGQYVAADVVRDGTLRHLLVGGVRLRLSLVDPRAATADEAAGGGVFRAPLPGRIVSVAVAVGDTVKAGQTLVVLEAMKMEHMISSPADGVVEAVHCAEGEQVEEGAELVAIGAAQ